MQRFFTVIMTVLIAAGAGCSRSPAKPEGFPELVPCKIKVIQGGAPLVAADVTLIPFDVTGTVWPVGGRTDAAGIAVMRTYGEHVGAPVGQYRVVVSKLETETTAPASTAGDQYRPAQERLYDLVDPALGFPPTTTLQIQIEEGIADYSVDVGNAVRILKQQP